MLNETTDSHKFSELEVVEEEETGVKPTDLVDKVGAGIWEALMCISS